MGRMTGTVRHERAHAPSILDRARGFVSRIKEASPVRIALAVQKRYGEAGAGMAASAVAFAGFFSLFPLLLLAASAVGFALAGDPAAQAEWTRRLANVIPGIGGLVGDNLSGLVEHRTTTGLAGVAGLAWSGTGIVRAEGQGLARLFGVDMPGGLLRSNIWALRTLLVLGVAWAGSTGLAAALGSLAHGSIQALGVGVGALAADTGALLLTYRLLVPGLRPGWRHLVPGTVFAAVGWTTLKLAGAWYVVRTVSNARAVYGTFAAAIGALALLALGARFLMYGAALNAVLIERGGASPWPQAMLTHAGSTRPREPRRTARR
jgi:membrane protein